MPTILKNSAKEFHEPHRTLANLADALLSQDYFIPEVIFGYPHYQESTPFRSCGVLGLSPSQGEFIGLVTPRNFWVPKELKKHIFRLRHDPTRRCNLPDLWAQTYEELGREGTHVVGIISMHVTGPKEGFSVMWRHRELTRELVTHLMKLFLVNLK